MLGLAQQIHPFLRVRFVSPYLSYGGLVSVSLISGKREQETPAQSDSLDACLILLSGWNESPRWGLSLPITS